MDTVDSPKAASSSPESVDHAIARIEGLLRSDPAAAERLAAEFLETFPGKEAILLLQGIARRLCGNPAGAAEVLVPLADHSPAAPIVHLQLGLALRESGQNTAAVAALERAVAVKPDYANAWLALADLLTSMGNGPGADRAFCTYVKYATQDPQLSNASTALREKRPADAILVLNRILEKYPNDVAALHLLAEAATKDRRAADAEMLLARCLDLAPGYREARRSYATILIRQGKLAGALAQVDLLLAAEPDNAAHLNLKAAIFTRLGDHEQAVAIYRKLIERVPSQPAAWSSLGHALRIVGRADECVDAYRRAIGLAPELGEAWWNLANLKTVPITDADVASMQAQLRRPDLADEHRAHFHFAVGKAFEDRRDFSESFMHYAEGNRLRRVAAGYDRREVEDHLRRSRQLYTTGFFAERKGCGCPAQDPIFIVGLPRVGSTLVEQILASHSRVEGTDELANLSAIAHSLGPANTGLTENRYPEIMAGLGRDVLARLGERYIDETRSNRKLGRPFFIDKMPNNFAHTGFIHLILPNARIIDVRRHPMACGWSLFKHQFGRGQGFSYGLEDIAAYYRSYAELMAHFDSVLPGRVHRVFYESLIGDTEAEVRKLLDYCDLPFEESCLKFHESRRPVSTPSSEQVRSPIFRSAVDHWRNYEPWLAPLREALGAYVDAYPAIPLQP